MGALTVGLVVLVVLEYSIPPFHPIFCSMHHSIKAIIDTPSGYLPMLLRNYDITCGIFTVSSFLLTGILAFVKLPSMQKQAR